MHILVTNDDGIMAPGLLALAQAMTSFGKVTILAPDRNWSGGGHVKTMHRPLRVKEVPLENEFTALAADGAPSDCVALATLGLVEQPIDLVVSGINPYGNMGHDVTYSGTVTAAMEAVISGIAGIAFSLGGNEHHTLFYYDTAAAVAHHVVGTFVENGLMPDMLINVNIPNVPLADVRGIHITRQGMRVYNSRLDRRLDPRGAPYYWIGGDVPSGIPNEGTDIGVMEAGFVSITPLDLDLTDYRRTQMISSWQWRLHDDPVDDPVVDLQNGAEPAHL